MAAGMTLAEAATLVAAMTLAEVATLVAAMILVEAATLVAAMTSAGAAEASVEAILAEAAVFKSSLENQGTHARVPWDFCTCLSKMGRRSPLGLPMGRCQGSEGGISIRRP